MTRQARPHLRLPREEARNTRAYRQLWRVVDGAVFDALYNHPDYLTPKGQRAARMSINKRVVGAVLSFAEQSAQGRSGQPAPERVDRVATTPARTEITRRVKGWAIWERIAHRLPSPRGDA